MGLIYTAIAVGDKLRRAVSKEGMTSKRSLLVSVESWFDEGSAGNLVSSGRLEVVDKLVSIQCGLSHISLDAGAGSPSDIDIRH
jgi:hypothetical protein